MLAGPGPLAGQPSAGQPPALTVSGVIYTQYAYALRRAAGAGHENNFDVTRAYLNFIGRFGEGVGSRLTGDIYRTGDGSLAYRLKYGYVSYRPGRGALTFKFGQFETPFVAYNENLWDYRMQGPDPTDRAGYLSSSDFGVGVEGTWNDDGVILSSGVFNGEFYSRRPGDQHKDVAARLSVRLVRSDERGSYGGLRLTGFALLGEPNGGGRRHRLLGQVSYRSRALLLAGTAMATRDRVDPEPTARGSLLSLMGVYRIPGIRAAIIGRFDTHDPNAEAPADALNRLIAGASYQVSPNLRVLVDLDQTWYEGRVSPAVDAARSQALFQLQLVF
jgi:hypothetical protein